MPECRKVTETETCTMSSIPSRGRAEHGSMVAGVAQDVGDLQFAAALLGERLLLSWLAHLMAMRTSREEFAA